MDVHEKLAVGPVNRVVERRAVEADLHPVDPPERPVQHEGVAYSGGHDVGSDAFLGSSGGHLGAIWVAEKDADLHAYLGSAGQQADHAGVLGEEQTAVGQDVDLATRALEEPPPDGLRYGPAVGIDGFHFAGNGSPPCCPRTGAASCPAPWCRCWLGRRSIVAAGRFARRSCGEDLPRRDLGDIHFLTSKGRSFSSSAYSMVWQQARRLALTPEQVMSPLAGRPYDLRHAAVSLWLNAGVPPTEAAKRAGHSVDVLLKVYAKCVEGQ
ncbi:hypothetical protein [Microbispora amethystogenes]|uniref:hypothetical protein n=1 Tax=Microbispora amethystogenes TaxID=1427754 RepID=UPI003F4CB351